MRAFSTFPLMASRVLRIVAAGVVVCACAGEAAAQTPRVEGPFAGLFGGSSANRKVTQSLDFRGSVFGLYQDVLKPTGPVPFALDPLFQTSGTFAGTAGSLAYSYGRSARRSSYYASAYGSAAGYSVNPEEVAATFSGETGLRTNLSQKVTFGLRGYGGYTPFYNFGSAFGGGQPVPGPAPAPPGLNNGFDQMLPGGGYGLTSVFNPTATFGAGSSLTATLTPRSSLSFNGDYTATKMVGPQSTNDGFTLWGAGGYFRHNVTKQLAFRIGYRREVSTNPYLDSRYTRNLYELGVDYGDMLNIPLGRRTNLSIVPAASVVRWNDGTYFRVNGSVQLVHSMGRTWSAMAGYFRDVNYVIGFVDPILTDTAQASIGGTLLPRVRWTTMASWSHGTIGFNGTQSYEWLTGSSGLSVALGKKLALYTQYMVYAYDVPPGSTYLQIVSTFARQTVSAGLTVYAPIFSTTGRTTK